MGEPDGRGVLGGILDDIRSKLVDEGWFGRRAPEGRCDPVSSLGEARGSASPDVDAAFAQAWALGEPSEEQGDTGREHGIDL